MTVVYLKEILLKTVVRSQEYVCLHETEAALPEIHFYQIKMHLLLKACLI